MQAAHTLLQGNSQPYHRERASEVLDGPPVDDRDEMLLGVQRSALRLLWDMRRRAGKVPAGFDAWAKDAGIDLTLLYDRVELGERVGFTVEEDFHFGSHAMGRRPATRMRDGCTVTVTAMKFLPMVPVSETREQCDIRRRRFRRERRKAMEQQEAADRPAVVITGTVAERRLASLLAVLASSPAKAITLAEAARKVARHEVWCGLVPATVAKYVQTMVRANPDLIASRPAHDGLTKLEIWRFPAGNGAKADGHVAELPVPQRLPLLGDFQKLHGGRCLSLLLKDPDDAVPQQVAQRADGIPDEALPPPPAPPPLDSQGAPHRKHRRIWQAARQPDGRLQ